jgi:multiple sugar transport system permease protein
MASEMTNMQLTKLERKKLGTWAQVKKSYQSYLLLGPFLVLFSLFTAIPVVTAILMSFTSFNMVEMPRFIGWANYSRLLLNDDVFIVAIRNTIVFSVITGPLGFMMCFVFAWIINEMSPKIRALMTVIFYAPSISGNVFVIFLVIFSGDRYGFFNGFLLSTGIVTEPIYFLRDENWIMPILILVQLWMSLGVGFLAFIAGLQTVNKEWYEAGAVDGIRNRWQELWYITLPCMRPQLMFAAILTIASSFSVAEISIQLAGFPSVNNAGATIVTHLVDYGGMRFEMGYAAAIATVLFLMMIGTNALVQRVLRRVGE